MPYKTGAKWAGLMQKFVPRSRIGIFLNEHTRWYETHQNMSLASNGVDQVLLLRNVRATNSRQNFLQRTHPIHPHCTLNTCFGAFCTIWVHLGLLSCLMKLGAKHSELVQKFVPRSRVRIFRNEHTRSTPLNPKLKFCCISYHLGAFGTIWLLTKLGAK